MLRPQEGAMAVSWSDLWELFTPHGCRVCGPVKFAGSLDFWVGLLLQIPEKKMRISLRVHYFFGWVQHFKIPRKLCGSPSSKTIWTSSSFEIPRNRGKTAFQEFFGSPKNRGTPRENPDFEPCSLQEKPRGIFGRACPSKSQDTAEKSAFWEFFGSPKNRGKPRKNRKFCNLYVAGKPQIKISRPVPKISQLAKPPIFLSFLLTSASK